MKNYIKILVTIMIVSSFVFTACGGDESSDDSPAKTYAIGDVGPSGVGIVFYVTDGGLHGLEAAPPNWSPYGAGDPQPAWSNISTHIGTSSTIGTGFANTNAIIAQPGHSNSAAKVCRDYTGGGKTDWFLPSSAELSQLKQQKDNVGGFTDWYWSSTEHDSTSAVAIDFDNPLTDYLGKSSTSYCRPVRAF